MNHLIGTVFLIGIAFAPASVMAQQMHGEHALDPAQTIELPAICQARSTGNAMGVQMDMPKEGVDAGHQALMDSMAEMHDTMNAALSAPDVDVAFICGMIPHHQGAIAMARAELAHGDDPWAKELAQNIISAQEKEIDEMLNWLEEQTNPAAMK